MLFRRMLRYIVIVRPRATVRGRWLFIYALRDGAMEQKDAARSVGYENENLCAPRPLYLSARLMDGILTAR